ncbi:hypothetical protein [Ornithinibacillus scapharcae]|uniref:hypothetical protein n=1 Tax=Ornithinibacillus scapharcae TaxID=1147159 RepID=UPI000225BDEF|nr:hypothetical protein [Ornithinibacillus scapharcae]
MKKILLRFGLLIVTISTAIIFVVNMGDRDSQIYVKQEDENVGKNVEHKSNTIEQLDNEESLETATIEISEYATMGEWVQETQESLKVIPENTTKESHYSHIGSVSSIYSRYFVERTNDSGIMEVLEEINKVGIEITQQSNLTKQEELTHKLYDLLEQIN